MLLTHPRRRSTTGGEAGPNSSRNGTHVERGKPDDLYKDVESTPQGVPAGQRVGDTGASKGRPVMGRIGLMPNPKGCLLPVGKDAREGMERQHDLAATLQ
jgi:hypothetical protein